MAITAKYNEIKSIEDMHDFMHNAITKVSFWGCRYVIKKNYTGYLSIDDLANKILSLIEALHYKYTSRQKTYGEAITSSITNLYLKSDNLVQQRNLLTRIFVFLRDVFLRIRQGFLSSVRHGWFVYNDRDVFSEVH